MPDSPSPSPSPRRAPDASLLAPAAAARETLWRTEQRVLALEQRCERDFAALFGRLDALPAAASFAPFAAVPSPRERAAEEAAAAAEGRAARARRSMAGGTSDRPDRSAMQSTARTPATAARQPSPPVRGVAQGARNWPFAVAAGADDALKRVELPGVAGQLLEGLSTVMPLPPGLGPLIEDLLARNPAPAKRAGASAFGDVNRLIGDALESARTLPPAAAAAIDRIGNRAANKTVRGVAAALQQAAQGANQALPSALPGLGGMLTGAVDDALQQGLAARTGAARAPSRLLPPADAGHAREDTARPPTQAADGTDAEGPIGALFSAPPTAAAHADELTAQLNRLLLDQAWLRGVDLR